MSLLYNKPPFNSQLLFAPTDGVKEGTLEGTSKEDMIDFLATDDEPDEVIPLEPDKKGKEEEVKEPEEEDGKEIKEPEQEEDELAELEAELEGPSDEQLELKTPVPRREILKKYPNLFKDFPYLETAYYREQQYTELFPTIDDAKGAVDKVKTLDKFEGELMNGNTENILKAVHTEDKDAFYKIVDDYLPTLAKVDEKAYNHVIGTVIKHTIMSMVNESRQSQNEALQTAAQLLNQFVFGTSDFKPPTNLTRGKRPEEEGKEDKLTEREREFTRRSFETARGSLNSRVENVIRSTITANIDPKKSMTDYVRRAAEGDALNTLTGLIERDSRFKSLMDRLWEKAFESNFDEESVTRIRKAYVSKAKTLLPSVIKKARNEALRGLGKRVKDEEEEIVEEQSTSSRKSERPTAPKNVGKIKNAKDIPAGMSTLDFLNSD